MYCMHFGIYLIYYALMVSINKYVLITSWELSKNDLYHHHPIPATKEYWKKSEKYNTLEL